MRKNTLFFWSFLLLFTTFLFLCTPKACATVYFIDNFDSDDRGNWIIEHVKPSDSNDTKWKNINWKISEDGLYGINLPYSEMHTYSAAGNVSWSKYIFKIKLLGKYGVDKNLIFRYYDKNNWYGFHMRNDGVFFGMTVNGKYFDTRISNFPFVNNIDYNLKVKLEDESFSFYVNDQPIVINYPLSLSVFGNNPIGSGKIALYVSTGNEYPSEVWFDNVMVCSLDDPCEQNEPEEPNKTVLIPGLGGSFSFDGLFLNNTNASDWSLTPFVNTYNNLQTAFENDNNFATFYYDWRRPVSESGEKLNNFIESKFGQDANVNLVGHSLGGLVGRACIEKQNGCHANKIITVGSPHLGVVDVYPAVAGGEIWRKGIMKLALELLVHYHQKPGETKKDTLQREVPVLEELLPRFNYLTKNGNIMPWDSLNIKNNLDLADTATVSGIIQTIFGNNKPTLKTLTVTDPNWLEGILGLWPDGKPLEPKGFANEGDGTVLSPSASLAHLVVPNYQFNLDHGEIISDKSPLEKIFSLLNKTLPDKTYSSLSEPENYLVFTAHSPVEFSCPQASASSYLNKELIIIPNPEDTTYNLQVKGTGNGSYLLSVGQIFGDRVIWNDYSGQASPSSLETYSFNIFPNNPLENPLINNNNALKNLITQTVNGLKDEINQQTLKDQQKSFLIYYLDNILSQLDIDLEKSIFHSNLFRDAVNFYQKSNVLSENTALGLLNTTSHLSLLLESFTLSFPKDYDKDEVDERLDLAVSAKELADHNVPDKSSALTYLQAMKKLEKATSLGTENLYKKYLLSSQAQFLFLESKLLK